MQVLQCFTKPKGYGLEKEAVVVGWRYVAGSFWLLHFSCDTPWLQQYTALHVFMFVSSSLGKDNQNNYNNSIGVSICSVRENHACIHTSNGKIYTQKININVGVSYKVFSTNGRVFCQ